MQAKAPTILLSILILAGASISTHAASGLEGTEDVIFGPADPSSSAQRQAWREMLFNFRAERLKQIGMPSGAYSDATSAWSDTAFRQYHLFMYDQAFLQKGHYRTSAWLDEVETRLGKMDAVLLWQAYPQLGIDHRNQFDYYRTMPGGLAGVRKQVSDVLHSRGVHVVIDFNPWDDHPNYSELADVVAALDADEVMLDTLDQVPPEMRAALDQRKPGVVLTPERRPEDAQLMQARSSWAQWYDLGPGDGVGRPAIFRQKWILPQHMQLSIRRWDTDRHGDIVFSFFNGAGMLVWDNVFGSWNPYSSADRRLLAETSAALHGYADVFSQGTWEPLLESGTSGLDLNRWTVASSGRIVLTLRNRTDRALQYAVPDAAKPSLAWCALWGPAKTLAPHELITIPARGTQALVLDQPAHALTVINRLALVGQKAEAADPGYDTVTPPPIQLNLAQTTTAALVTGFARIPGGQIEMHIEHERRESGCYPWGADDSAMWGWFYKDTISHSIRTQIAPFAMTTTAVTNSQYLRFVRETGYRPMDADRFLQQLPRGPAGAWPLELPEYLAAQPVTFVDLEDARAYARWAGGRLPTEAEWQWAAEGAGAGNPWPWGKGAPESLPNGWLNRSGKLGSAGDFAQAATPQGVLGLSGNAWEWTDSEWSDGHNRFAMLRGGTFLPQPSRLSEWMLPRGAHPNNFHAKYFLVSGGLDRAETISFRVVKNFPKTYRDEALQH